MRHKTSFHRKDKTCLALRQLAVETIEDLVMSALLR